MEDAYTIFNNSALDGGRDCIVNAERRDKKIAKLKRDYTGRTLAAKLPYKIPKAKVYSAKRIKKLPKYVREAYPYAELQQYVENKENLDSFLKTQRRELLYKVKERRKIQKFLKLYEELWKAKAMKNNKAASPAAIEERMNALKANDYAMLLNRYGSFIRYHKITKTAIKDLIKDEIAMAKQQGSGPIRGGAAPRKHRNTRVDAPPSGMPDDPNAPIHIFPTENDTPGEPVMPRYHLPPAIPHEEADIDVARYDPRFGIISTFDDGRLFGPIGENQPMEPPPRLVSTFDDEVLFDPIG